MAFAMFIVPTVNAVIRTIHVSKDAYGLDDDDRNAGGRCEAGRKTSRHMLQLSSEHEGEKDSLEAKVKPGGRSFLEMLKAFAPS